MRTMLRSKVTLLFLALGMLLAVPAIALADIVVADGDTTIARPQDSRDLGTVQPGATRTPNVDFYLRCDTQQHFNQNDTASINFVGATIRDANNVAPTTGSASATSLAAFTGPNNWVNDGTGCPTGISDRLLGSSTSTIVAPKKPGTYTVQLNYRVDQAESTTNRELQNNINNDPLTFTLTVPNVAPVINTFSGDASATEGQTKTYSINATDANDDSLTYGLQKASTGGANVTIAATATAGSFNVKFDTAGSVDLRASASDGTNTTTQTRTVSVASACTVPSVTTQPTNQTVTYGANATFTADANGTNPSVKWQVLGTGQGATWTDVANATSKTLTVSNPAVADSGKQYRAVFSNGCGSATSSAATLTVNKATANVQLSNLGPYTYDGTAKSASATTTNPSGLNVSITYNGSSTAPTDAGTYPVVATVNEANYQGSASGTLKIDQAEATIKVDGFDGTYDGNAHGATGTATGVGGSNLNSLLHLGDSFTDVPGGTANWTFEGNGNHKAASGSVDIKIAKASSTTKVTCPASVTYTGQPLTPCTVEVTGAGGLSLTPNADHSNNTNAGTATASYTYAASANHTGSNDSKTFTIGKAQLSVNAKNQSTVYGDSHLASSHELSGFVNGQTAATAGVTGAPECSITSSATNVGTYPGVISCTTGTLDAANYSFASGTNGDLTITKRPIAVTPDAGQSKTYGDNDPTLEFRLANGTTLGHTDTLADATDGALSRASGEDVGTYAINQGSLLATGNYSLSFVANGATFEIKPKPITITPNAGQSKVYGQQSDPALTYTPSPALKSGDNFTGALSRAPGENAGNYAITLGSLSAGTNYTLSLSSTPVNFAITQKPITGSFTADNKTYDGTTAATVLSRSVDQSALVGNDAVTLVGGTAQFDDKNAGTGKTVTLTGATLGGTAAGNYDLTSVGTTKADILKAELTVTADNQSKTYDGNPFTNFTSKTTGFVNAEPASVVSGSVSYGGTAVGAVNAGSYTIIPDVSGLGATNYTFKAANGTLTINKATQTITFGALSGKIVGATFTVNATATSGLPVSFAASGSCTVSGTNVSVTGVGPCTITASQAGNSNYFAATNVQQSFNASYNFTGFASPVDNNNVLNTAKAGQAIPLKWRLTDASGNPVTNLSSVKVTATSLNCALGTTTDLLEEYAAGSSGLQNLGDGYYQFNWKSPTTYANSCKTLNVDMGEGAAVTHTALFKFTK